MKNIPVITVSGRALAKTYEAALINLYERGTSSKDKWYKYSMENKYPGKHQKVKYKKLHVC